MAQDNGWQPGAATPSLEELQARSFPEKNCLPFLFLAPPPPVIGWYQQHLALPFDPLGTYAWAPGGLVHAPGISGTVTFVTKNKQQNIWSQDPACNIYHSRPSLQYLSPKTWFVTERSVARSCRAFRPQYFQFLIIFAYRPVRVYFFVCRNRRPSLCTLGGWDAHAPARPKVDPHASETQVLHQGCV